MREIRFRGLRIDGKGWVYGGYFQHTPDEDGVIYYIFDFNEGAVEVITESVGQFTGLYDKNGKEIYEGDIVSYKRNVGNWTGKSLTTIHEIIFTEEINAFVMKDNSSYIKLRKHWGYEYEVIGNIYKNA